jgi:hypothetical protein
MSDSLETGLFFLCKRSAVNNQNREDDDTKLHPPLKATERFLQTNISHKVIPPPEILKELRSEFYWNELIEKCPDKPRE